MDLGQIVNIDYEYALFDPHYEFKKIKYQRIRQELEYLYLLIDESKKPLFNEVEYEETYLNHLRKYDFNIADLTQEKGDYWFGDMSLDKKFNSKVWSSELGKELFDIKTYVVQSREEILKITQKSSHEEWILRSPYLFSGIEHFIFHKNTKTFPDFRFPLILDPFRKIVMDIGVRVHEDIDIYEMSNSKKGQFQGLRFTRDSKKILSEISDFKNQIEKSIQELRDRIPKGIEFNIDMYLYEDCGGVKLNPLCEVNTRKSMGSLCGALRRFLKNNDGKIIFSTKKEREGLLLSPKNSKFYLTFNY